MTDQTNKGFFESIKTGDVSSAASALNHNRGNIGLLAGVVMGFKEGGISGAFKMGVVGFFAAHATSLLVGKDTVDAWVGKGPDAEAKAPAGKVEEKTAPAPEAKTAPTPEEIAANKARGEKHILEDSAKNKAESLAALEDNHKSGNFSSAEIDAQLDKLKAANVKMAEAGNKSPSAQPQVAAQEKPAQELAV